MKLTVVKFPLASLAASVETVAALATPVPVGNPVITGVVIVGEVPRATVPVNVGDAIGALSAN